MRKKDFSNETRTASAGRAGRAFSRTVAFLSALALAGTASFAVYASVVYDSSKDPVVAYSAMEQYVTGQLESVLSRLDSIENRVQIVELTGGGGSGGGSGSGISSEGLTTLLNRIAALESGMTELQQDNANLRSELSAAKKELNDLISELQTQYNTLKVQVEGLEDEIVSLQNSITSVKKDISTLNTNFKQISAISTKLETVTYKVNSLTGSSGDITLLKQDVERIRAQYEEMLEKVGTLYEVVMVPYGATIYADGDEDTVMAVLRSGSAVAVSPYRDAGTAQGLNDLSDGTEIYDGQFIPLFHNLLIPRGGSDGRGIKVTSIDGAYMMLGGDYRIVQE